jgi:hypothetical protein
MEFRVPERALGPLAEFIRLPDEAIYHLIEALGEAHAAPRVEDVAEVIAAATSLDVDEVERILSMFAGMHLSREASQVSLADFVKELASSLEKRADPKLTPTDWSVFRNNVSAILSAESLTISAKAQDLVFENEHGLHSVRIITDVRHIFGAEPKDRPKACVIVHMLNIVYHDIDGMKEFYVAIDRSALEHLKLAIERAEVKERNLASISKETGIDCLLG